MAVGLMPMELAQAVLPQVTIYWVVPFIVAIYGVRYLGMATVAYLIARPTPRGGWGRPHANAPQSFDFRRHVGRELRFSMGTIVAFGLVIGSLYWGRLLESSQLYYRFSSYPA